MKKNIILLLFFTSFFSCKEVDVPTCENGRYDEGEIGLDCGGICPDCVFDKNDIVDKDWKDIESDFLQIEDVFLANHKYSSSFNSFHPVWGNSNSAGSLVVTGVVPSWSWINESDTLKFNWISSNFIVERKIVYVGDDFYKFKTNQDDWKYIHSSILGE